MTQQSYQIDSELKLGELMRRFSFLSLYPFFRGGFSSAETDVVVWVANLRVTVVIAGQSPDRLSSAGSLLGGGWVGCLAGKYRSVLTI